jgi:hypothetical protein
LCGFPVLLHADYSAVCAAGWCGVWGCARTVDIGVRGWRPGGQVCAQCVGHGERCRLRAAPHLREFSVLLRVGYSAMCAVGLCGIWGCVGTVDMGVRGWGVEGVCVHSVLGMV